MVISTSTIDELKTSVLDMSGATVERIGVEYMEVDMEEVGMEGGIKLKASVPKPIELMLREGKTSEAVRVAETVSNEGVSIETTVEDDTSSTTELNMPVAMEADCVGATTPVVAMVVLGTTSIEVAVSTIVREGVGSMKDREIVSVGNIAVESAEVLVDGGESVVLMVAVGEMVGSG